MRKALLYIAAAFAVVVLLLFFGLYWLFGTTSGARFLLTTGAGMAGVDVSVARVEGRVVDRLHLTGVRYKKQKLTAQADSLELYWEPDRLFNGNLLVHRLILANLRVQDDTPPTGKAPQLRWPQASPLLRRFSGTVEQFRITGLSYRHLQGTPVLVTDLSSSLTLKDGLLTLSGVNLTSPQGRAKGELALGLSRPSLRTDLVVLPARPVQGMDLFSLQGRLAPDHNSEFMVGPIAAAGRSGGAQRLELTAELGVTDHAFDFRRLSLFRPGRRGTVTGEGRVTLTATEPLYNLALRVKDLDLAAELKRPARVSGFVNFSGSQSRYAGNLSLSNVGPGWQSASLATGFKGGKEGARLAPISGAVLDGRISGALDVLWREGMRVRGVLSGRGLNPARLAPDWRGVVNLDLAADFSMPKQGGAKGALRGKLLESRLHGQELKGELDGAFAGKNVRIDRLLLVGRGFDLRGAGELERRVNFQARVSDLSRLVPGSAGQVNAGGWVRYRDGLFAGAAKGEGSNIAAAGAKIASAKLDAALGAGPAYPVHLNAALTSLQVGRLQVATALLTLDGTAARHTLDAELAAAQGRTHLTLKGGLEGKTWRGELTRFSGSDTVGPWSLTAPAAIVAGSSGFAVSPLVINGLPGERAELAGELRRQPGTGNLHGSWSGINLARVDAWLQGVQVSGATSGNLALRLLPGNRVQLNGQVEANGTMVSNGQRVTLERMAVNLEGGEQGWRTVADLYLANGQGDGHLLFTSHRPATLALPEEGDLKLQLANLDLALFRPMMQENAQLNGKVAGVVSGRLLPGRRLDLRGNVAVDQGTLAYRGEAETFDAVISSAELAFNWRGGMGGGKGGGGLELTARAAANGVYTGKGQRIAITRCELRADADEHGSRAAFDLVLDQGGVLRAAVSSSAPASLGVPETGEFAMEWGGIDQKLIRPFLPGALNIEGELAGQARGRLLPGKRVEMTGETSFSGGRANWRGSNGEMNARIRSATLSFIWRGETLSTTLDLALAEYGKGSGNLILPVPARLPVVPNRNGPIRGGFSGSVQERGFLTAFLPGLVQESHGQLDLDLKLAGTWGDPQATGRMQLSKAGAYLPSAGIRVENVQLLALLEGDQIRIDNFSATSGSGRITGNLQARLEGWQVASYSGSISGDRFQTVYLPELQMVTSPQLTFRGEGNTVSINGTVNVPQMLVAGPPARPVVGPSKDVVLEGEPPEQAAGKKFPLLVEGRIHVALGDKVQVKASGIDATMGGTMDLVLDGLDNITSRGEIRVVKGSYKAYGMELEIVRGRIYYVDDPVDQPTLDILALRTVADVKAGVTVAGYLRAPVIKLYSEPSMPDVDVLAYMVLGHPLSSTSTDQAGMVATAASSLFSFGESESVQEQIKSRLGLSVLGMETVNPQAAGRMGYQEIPVAPSGVAPQKPATTQSLLTVGKYLTPKLYLSYGRSLVTGGSMFMLRYDIFKHWQVETQSGTESGGDIYYKLEFD